MGLRISFHVKSVPISSADELIDFKIRCGLTLANGLLTGSGSSVIIVSVTLCESSLIYRGVLSNLSNLRCLDVNGDDSLYWLPITEILLFTNASSSPRCAAFDWRRLSQIMLRLSDVPKFVMHEMLGCFESLMNLGLLRGRQKSGGGKSR